RRIASPLSAVNCRFMCFASYEETGEVPCYPVGWVYELGHINWLGSMSFRVQRGIPPHCTRRGDSSSQTPRNDIVSTYLVKPIHSSMPSGGVRKYCVVRSLRIKSSKTRCTCSSVKFTVSATSLIGISCSSAYQSKSINSKGSRKKNSSCVLLAL